MRIHQIDKAVELAGWLFSCLVYQTGVLGGIFVSDWAWCQSQCVGEPNTRLCDQSLACEGEGEGGAAAGQGEDQCSGPASGM